MAGKNLEEHLSDFNYNLASERWYGDELVLKQRIEDADSQGALEALEILEEDIALRFSEVFSISELNSTKIGVIGGIIHFALRDANVPPSYLTLMIYWQTETLILAGSCTQNEQKISTYLKECVIQACNLANRFAYSNYSLLVQKAISYIHLHLTEDINIYELSKALKMSRQYLSTQFHKETRKTLADYINQERIHLSKSYLENQSLSITKIAFMCGYNDSTYFTRIFKKYEGMTPRQYRVLHK